VLPQHVVTLHLLMRRHRRIGVCVLVDTQVADRRCTRPDWSMDRCWRRRLDWSLSTRIYKVGTAGDEGSRRRDTSVAVSLRWRRRGLATAPHSALPYIRVALCTCHDLLRPLHAAPAALDLLYLLYYYLFLLSRAHSLTMHGDCRPFRLIKWCPMMITKRTQTFERRTVLKKNTEAEESTSNVNTKSYVSPWAVSLECGLLRDWEHNIWFISFYIIFYKFKILQNYTDVRQLQFQMVLAPTDKWNCWAVPTAASNGGMDCTISNKNRNFFF
jgi:hypothetical protein